MFRLAKCWKCNPKNAKKTYYSYNVEMILHLKILTLCCEASSIATTIAYGTTDCTRAVASIILQ